MNTASSEMKIAAYQYAIKWVKSRAEQGWYCGVCMLLCEYLSSVHISVQLIRLDLVFPEFYKYRKADTLFWWPSTQSGAEERVRALNECIDSITGLTLRERIAAYQHAIDKLEKRVAADLAGAACPCLEDYLYKNKQELLGKLPMYIIFPEFYAYSTPGSGYWWPFTVEGTKARIQCLNRCIEQCQGQIKTKANETNDTTKA